MTNNEFTLKVSEALALNGFENTVLTAEKFAIYYEMLVDFNRRVNLTAITEPDEVINKHFIDSLLPLKLAPKELVGCGADVGTGAGFPGVPLAIMCPNTEFVLMDSLKKRLDFLDALIEKTGLRNCRTVHIRAEDAAKTVGGMRETFDFTLSRAVARLASLSELCLPLVKVGGSMLALKSRSAKEELGEAGYAISLLGGKTRGVFGTEERNVIIIDKNAPTPAIYPRKAGTPEKNPLKRDVL